MGPELDALILPGRVHEATGPGRVVFALALAGVGAGAVLWLHRGREQLCPQGIAPLVDPGRLILVQAPDDQGLLQAMEAALRSGAVALAVADLARAPDLTASRRLQLAAGGGGGRGLCLLPEAGQDGTAAETRWHCAQVPGGSRRAGQRWELLKNKRGPLGAWTLDPLVAAAGTGASPHPTAPRVAMPGRACIPAGGMPGDPGSRGCRAG